MRRRSMSSDRQLQHRRIEHVQTGVLRGREPVDVGDRPVHARFQRGSGPRRARPAAHGRRRGPPAAAVPAGARAASSAGAQRLTAASRAPHPAAGRVAGRRDVHSGRPVDERPRLPGPGRAASTSSGSARTARAAARCRWRRSRTGSTPAPGSARRRRRARAQRSARRRGTGQRRCARTSRTRSGSDGGGRRAVPPPGRRARPGRPRRPRSSAAAICCRTAAGLLPLSCRSSESGPMPDRGEPLLDDVERGPLLRDEQHPPALATACASRLVIVCDLPVPGWALQHERPPGDRVGTAAQLGGVRRDGTAARRARPGRGSPAAATGSANASVGVCRGARPAGSPRRSAQLSSRSFHSRNFANWRTARSAVGSTRNAQPALGDRAAGRVERRVQVDAGVVLDRLGEPRDRQAVGLAQLLDQAVVRRRRAGLVERRAGSDRPLPQPAASPAPGSAASAVGARRDPRRACPARGRGCSRRSPRQSSGPCTPARASGSDTPPR